MTLCCPGVRSVADDVSVTVVGTVVAVSTIGVSGVSVADDAGPKLVEYFMGSYTAAVRAIHRLAPFEVE